LVTIPTMLHCSSFVHNTDYVIPFVFCSQHRLCYTIRLVVAIPTMLYRSSFGHNTDYVIPFVFWSQYRLCYTVRFVVTRPTMLHRSSCGHNTDYVIAFVFWSQYRLCYTDPMFYCQSEKYENCKKSADYSFKFCNVIRFGFFKRTSLQFISLARQAAGLLWEYRTLRYVLPVLAAQLWCSVGCMSLRIYENLLKYSPLQKRMKQFRSGWIQLSQYTRISFADSANYLC
jgi:hypothetical protein